MDEPTDHCEHCDKQSCRWVSEGLAELHRDHNGAEWAGICPACAERERIVSEIEKYAAVANASQRARGDVRITDNPFEAIANLVDAQIERILRQQVELIRHGYIVVAGES